MNKSTIGIMAILCIAAFSLGCINEIGSGKIIKESRNVTGFKDISPHELMIVIDMANESLLVESYIIKQGYKDSLVIGAEDNIIPHIKTNIEQIHESVKTTNPRVEKVLNTTIPFLVIESDDNMPTATKPITIYITVKDLKSVSYGGWGYLNIFDVNSEDLDISISSNAIGNFDNIQTNTLYISVTHFGKANATGRANNQIIRTTGSAKYNATNLECQKATVVVEGQSQVIINVKEELNVEIIGPGRLYYIGNPRITQKISGGGKIVKISN